MANNEWGTPPHYIESARKVMGSIDTDPASNEQAQLTVQAKTYYTQKRSGLEKLWHGNVWLNPPYGYGLAKPFCRDLAENYRIGFTTQAIVLTNNVPDTIWWKTYIGEHCTALCLPDHRIGFINPETGMQQRGNDRNQLFAYLGDNVDAFIAEFSQYGLCSVPVRLAA